MSQRVPRREQLAFAAGDTGFNFVWQTIELYLLFYYVRIIGVAPQQAAMIFLAGAAVDLVADPLIGTLVDRTSSRFPVRRWLIIAGPPLGIALALAFLNPSFAGSRGLLFLTLTHLLLRWTYSLGNIPYAALTSRITDNAGEQVALTSMRMQGAAVGGLIAALAYLAFPLERTLGGVPIGAIVLGLAAQPLFVLCWFGVRERAARPEGTPQPASRIGYLALLRSSGLLRRLLLLIFFLGMSATALHKGLMFAFDRLGERHWGYVAALFPAVALFVGARLWTRLAAWRGRVFVIRLAVGMHLLAIVGAMLVDGSLIISTLFLACAIFASTGMSTMFWALVPGVIAACERDHPGEACAARIFGLANVARKVAQAAAPQVLAASLYLTSKGALAGMAVAAVLAMMAAIYATPRPGEVSRARASPE